jgi:hypothetical protein
MTTQTDTLPPKPDIEKVQDAQGGCLQQAGSPFFGGYLIAIKHPTSEFGEWCISPKWYFRRHGRIPDTKANLNLPHLDEIMDHVLKSTDGSDGEHLLSRYGIEVVRNPIWYFQREEVPGAE